MEINGIVDVEHYPLSDLDFQRQCRATLDEQGVVSLAQFIQGDSLEEILAESLRLRKQAYFCRQTHSVYLNPPVLL
ncbi:hypothetical protein N9049_00530 [bacterium]|nr:hypothetical protein [bacterium]